MKKIIVVLLLMLHINAFSQVKGDYVHAIDQFAKFYNQDRSDSIYGLVLSREFWNEKQMKELYSAKTLKKIKKDFGTIVSYKYVGTTPKCLDTRSKPMAIFKITYSKAVEGKKVHAMSISLDNENRIYGFNFMTSSPEIDSMLAKS